MLTQARLQKAAFSFCYTANAGQREEAGGGIELSMANEGWNAGQREEAGGGFELSMANEGWNAGQREEAGGG